MDGVEKHRRPSVAPQADGLPPVSRIYWALVAASVAGMLFAVAPQQKDLYAGATDELQHLASLGLSIDDTYGFVHSHLVNSEAGNVPGAIRSVVEDAGVTGPIGDPVEEDFFWVAGPAPLGLPDQVAAAYRLFKQNPAFTAYVPNGDSLRVALQSILVAVDSAPRFLDPLGIACNYAGGQCRVNVTLRRSRTGDIAVADTFFVPRDTIAPEGATWHALAREQDEFFRGSAAELPHTGQLLPQLYDLELDQAVREVTLMAGADLGEVSAFGIVLKENLVLTVLPWLLSFAMLFMLASLRESAHRLNKRVPDEFRSIPIFFTNRWARIGGWAVVLALPMLVVLVLLFRFADRNKVSTAIAALALLLMAQMGVMLVKWNRVRLEKPAEEGHGREKSEPTPQQSGFSNFWHLPSGN